MGLGRVKDEVAIITGAANGIGKAIAQVFAEEGAKVVIADIDKENGQKAADDLIAKGHDALFVHTDIAIEESAQNLATQTFQKYGKIDILVNNAAVFIFTGHEGSAEAWNKAFSINVTGYAIVSKHVAHYMKQVKKGSIVNLGSMSSFIAQKDLVPYSTTKAAVVGMSKNYAFELAPYNIRVNCVCPGPTWTDGSVRHAKMLGLPHDEYKAQETALILLKRFADPVEIAYPVLFLASKEASFVTGTHLLVDGGYTAW